jgi:Zn-dependent protease
MHTFDVKVAFYLLVALIPSLVLHEFAHVLMAERMGDYTARRFGRRTLRPKPHVDSIGTVILPALLLLLTATGYRPIVFAYAKPLPFEPGYLRDQRRGTILYAVAGPAMNLLLAIGLAALIRLGLSGNLGLFVREALVVNVILCVFNLMPIPGLDGARLLALYLPPRAAQVFRGLDQYLPLFMLVIFFILGAPVLVFVHGIGNALCQGLSGSSCF